MATTSAAWWPRRAGQPAGLATLARVALLAWPAWATGPAAAADGVDRLHWLAGCWAAEGGEPGSGETWTAPAGGTMLGIGRTVRGGRTVAHEFVQIRQGADGRLAYTATPSGQREATFTLLRLSDTEVVFENPAHDYPQRVIYRRIAAEHAPERITGRIEGLLRGVERAVDFPLRRTDCTAARGR